MKSTTLFYLSLFLLLSSESCKDEIQQDIPEAIEEIIEAYKKDEAKNPPVKVFSYIFENKTVYYIPSFCCDMMSTVYDEKGNIICHPDGGFTGKGDGKCINFFNDRSEEKLIWADPR